MKVYEILLIAGLFFTIGCQEQKCEVSKEDFDDLTSVLFQLEESNRIDFRQFAFDNHLSSNKSNAINKSIITLYDIIDVSLEDLLLKSDGYNQKGELIGGLKKGIGAQIFENNSFVKNINAELNRIKDIIDKEEFPNGNEAIAQIESSLYPLLNMDDATLQEQTNAKLYLLLTVVQNRLLIAEMMYFETQSGISSPDSV